MVAIKETDTLNHEEIYCCGEDECGCYQWILPANGNPPRCTRQEHLASNLEIKEVRKNGEKRTS